MNGRYDQYNMTFGLEWAWVGGYTTLSSLVVIFNLLLFFSVLRNKFLHYSFHYLVLALSIRNLCQVCLTLWLVFLAKLVQLPWLLQATMSSDDLDLTQSTSMPLMCQILSMSDHFLMTTLMIYMASLSVYLLSRKPNPPLSTMSQTTWKLYGLNTGLVPVKEKWWVSFLLLLLPPVLSALLCLPSPLLYITHPLIALPGGSLCNVPDTIQFNTYHLSVAILGFCVPVLVIFFILIALSIRRCITCVYGSCASSFCKEEVSLLLLSLPYIVIHLTLYLPLLDHYLDKLQLPQLGLQSHVAPEVARAVETVMGLLLPAVLYSLLPAYSRFSSEPDGTDMKRSQTNMDNMTHSRRISEASLAISSGGYA